MTRWLIAATLALGIAACGSDDSDSSGTGGSAGSGAAGGTGGSGGAGGVGASSGAGGVAGSAATGGTGGASGGDAGLDGTADAPNDAETDASADTGDASTLPLPGFGNILGDCGPIDPTEILSTSPYSFENSLDFGTMPFDYAALSPGGKKVHDDGNLGGSSLHSEIFSYEVLYRCELATLLKTEAAIGYSDAGTKKTDLLVQIDGYKIGVSVTRAYAFPPGSTFSVAQAESLLDGKLSDILSSSASVSPADAWEKQILHVLAYNQQHRDSLAQAYPNIPASTRADTIVMVTVTDGDDAFIY